MVTLLVDGAMGRVEATVVAVVVNGAEAADDSPEEAMISNTRLLRTSESRA